MKNYKAYLIDNDDTIMDFSACSKAALFESLDRPANIDMLFTVYIEENDKMWSALERGEITQKELREKRFINFRKRTGVDIDPAAVSLRYMDELSRQSVFMPGGLELLEILHKKAKLYMITNGISMIQRGRIAAAGIEKYFDGIFISEEMGAKKPDKEYFDIVLEAVPYDKSDVLLIGDSASADIKGGQNAGIDTLWLSRGKNPPAVPPTYKFYDTSALVRLLTSGDDSVKI